MEREKKAPREVEPRPAALRPDEQELGEVSSTHTTAGGELTTETAGLPGACPEERSPDLSNLPVEGWVADMPVIEGVADSGWVESARGRFRVQMVVRSSEIQRNWVRSMVFSSDGETPDLS